MRVAIFDNLANSAYVEAKVFRRRGYEVDVVLDPMDSHVMSDPRWEDLDLQLETASLERADFDGTPLSDWVRAPSRAAPARSSDRYARALTGAVTHPATAWRSLRRGGTFGAALAGQRAWAIDTLRDYDAVIAFGIGAPLCGLAGVPCVMQGWGGDVTIIPFADEDPSASRWEAALARLQRFGLEAAGRIIFGDPRYVPYLERLGLMDKCVFIGAFVDTVKYSDGEAPELRADLLGAGGEQLVFVPSRQDFRWKGSDRMLRGFALAAADRPGVRMVCPGWGADLERSKALAAVLGIAARVRFLSYAISKTRLLRYYRAADVVLDQFTLGFYGTSTLEALLCCRPVLMHLDEESVARWFGTVPPVANCSEPEEIAAALGGLLDDEAERRRLGQEGRRWVVENHAESRADLAMELCRAAVAEHCG